MFTWHPLTEPPTKTGRYLLGHRGHITAHNHFFAPDRAWMKGVKMGWTDGALAHRPTHWMYVPSPPRLEMENR